MINWKSCSYCEYKETIERNKKLLEEQGLAIDIIEGGIGFKTNMTDGIEMILLVEIEIEVRTGQGSNYMFECLKFVNGSNKVKKFRLTSDEFLNGGADMLQRKFGMTVFGDATKAELVWKIFRNSVYNAERTIVYDNIGWRTESDRGVFIYGNQKVSSNGFEKTVCLRKCRELPNKTNYEVCNFVDGTYLKIMNSFYAKIYLTFFCLSNLKFILKQKGIIPSFILYIKGESGTGKTSTTLPMLNPFDLDCISIGDSSAAAMTTLNTNKLGVTLFDDFKSKRNSTATQLLEKIIRISGDATTSNRRMCGKSVEKVDFDNLVAVTAEVDPPVQTSSFARMLILEFDQSTINLEQLKMMEANSEQFKNDTISFLMKYLQWVLCGNELDSICEDIKNHSKKYLEAQWNLHGRYINIISQLTGVWNSIWKFCDQHGVDLDKEFENDLIKLVRHQNYTKSHQPIPKLYCHALFMLVEDGKVNIVDNTILKECNNLPDIIIKDGIWQIRNRSVFGKIKQLYEGQLIDFNYTEKRIRTELMKSDLILKSTNPNTKTTDNRRINNLTYSYMSFCPGKAKEYLERVDIYE